MTTLKQPWLALAASVVLVVGLVWGVAELSQRLSPVEGELPPRSSESPSSDAPSSDSPAVDGTGLGLTLPAGFRIEIFTEGLERPRVLLIDPIGVVVASDQAAGTVVALPDADRDGRADVTDPLVSGLRGPHGLQFLPDGRLLIAEEHQVGAWRYSSDTEEWVFDAKLADLPSDGGHSTRTLQLAGDGQVYVTIGSSCNVCDETDERRAAMYRFNPDGSDFVRWARGLRNTVFFVPHPETGVFWGNDMGRDQLGDNLPPDELNIIPTSEGPIDEWPGNYGWPICYGDNVHDTEFDQSLYKQAPCAEPRTLGSWFDYPAHVAPLGLRFIPAGVGWPADWEGDLLVAWHGSWNSSIKVGYKVVRLELDVDQKIVAVHDFVTGFLKDDGEVIGRPVDLFFSDSGVLYLSDDGAGRIFRITPLQS